MPSNRVWIERLAVMTVLVISFVTIIFAQHDGDHFSAFMSNALIFLLALATALRQEG